MIQNEVISKVNFANVGEEISHELAAKMVKNYQDVNPNDNNAFHIGKNIINQVLAQPGCVGMRFYNAIDENGKRTLVYAGLDEKGATIFEITAVNAEGK